MCKIFKHFNRKEKQLEVKVLGHELSINPSADITLSRLKGRLRRIEKMVQSLPLGEKQDEFIKRRDFLRLRIEFTESDMNKEAN